MISLTGENFIAGKESSNGKNTFQSINPETGEKSSVTFSNATSKEIAKAVIKAQEAFHVTSNYSPDKFALLLETVCDEIMILGDELLEIANWETALGLPRLLSERARTCNQLLAFANYIREGSYVEAIIDVGDSTRKPNPKPDIRRMLIPIGPVGIFPASNFPLAFGVCGGDTASAWAAGCPVIIKGHPSHPQTSEIFAQIVNKAIVKTNFPRGWFSFLQGKEHRVGKELALHPDIEAIGFTGSQQAGKAIFDLAVRRERPIPVYAEMSSINPIVVSGNSLENNLNTTAIALVNSITLGVGQFCTKPGIIFIPIHKKTNDFIARVKELMEEKNTPPLLNEAIKCNLEERVRETKELQGVELLLGGKNIEDKLAYENTLFLTKASIFAKHKEFQQEHFGPTAIIVKYLNSSRLKNALETLEGQLTGSIYLEESEYPTFNEIIHLLEQKVGRLIFNGVPTGVEVCPAMQHGGPFPATTDQRTTSVGLMAIKRFLRPVAFQDMAEQALPMALKNENTLNILRLVNGKYTREPILK